MKLWTGHLLPGAGYNQVLIHPSFSSSLIRSFTLFLLIGQAIARLAIDTQRGQVVGCINVLSDGLLAAFIPLLEVLPDYQGQGIGSELVRRMLASLSHLYSIDVICDTDVQPFYERCGMMRYTGMIKRHYHNQAGASE